MTEESIFHGIVQTEDEYTQLLFNLMARDEQFRAVFLAFLFNRSDLPRVDRHHLFVQKGLANQGIADLLIETGTFSVIVEVKTERVRGRTGRQLLYGPEDDPGSYLSYLTSKAKQNTHAILVFLIPPDWKYKNDVEREIEKFVRRGHQTGVRVLQLTWQELLQHCENAATNDEIPFWQDFKNLLKARFNPLRLTDAEVNTMNDGKMTLLTTVKLNKIIVDVRMLAKRAGLPVTVLAATDSEFGFYLKKDNIWAMFVGCAPAYAWENGTPALCCQGDPRIAKPCKKAFQAVLGGYVIPEGDWIAAAFPDHDLTLGAEYIFNKLEQIWMKVSGIPQNNKGK